MKELYFVGKIVALQDIWPKADGVSLTMAYLDTMEMFKQSWGPYAANKERQEDSGPNGNDIQQEEG